MSRKLLVGLCLSLLVLATGVFSFLAANEGKDDEDTKPDQELTIKQQFEAIDELQRKRPQSAEEYLGVQKQVQKSADRILSEVEKGTDDYKKAYQLSRQARIRTLTLVDEKEQTTIANLLMDEVKAKKTIELSDAQLGMGLAQGLELSQRNKLAGKAYLLYGNLLAKSDDEQLSAISEMFLSAGRRQTLVGKPMKLTGTTVDGKEFDLADLKGKVVLVDFWATWCRPCLAEYPNILRNYEAYHDRGFDVVGVSLDQNREALESYLEKKEVPWATLHDEESGGRHPAAVYYGISGIPAMFLVGKDGNVVSLSARGEELNILLAELIGPLNVEESESTAEESESAVEESRSEKEKPSSVDGAKAPLEEGVYFVSAPAAVEEPNDESAEESAEDEGDSSSLSEKKINPYAAPRGMATPQLVDYIFDMEEKPRTIQERPGFSEAVIEAAERLIEKEKSGTYWRLGVLAKLKFLHKKASLKDKDKEADKKLSAFVQELNETKDKRIGKELRFLKLERKAIDADDLPLEEIPDLLAELDAFFKETRLNERHLRIASATIRAVNRLDSEDEEAKKELAEKREKYFTSFGELFAKSTDQELSQYGKKLAKKTEAEESDLVGKPLELAGTTFEGSEFDWKAYRGKVVLVDFWATWCGPCIREMPNVRALYDGNKDKGFTVVGVSLDKDLEKLGQFIADNKVPWTNLAGDGTQALAKKYGVRGIPTMMLIDREGNIVGVSHNVAALSKKAEQLLAKPAVTKEKAKPAKQAG